MIIRAFVLAGVLLAAGPALAADAQGRAAPKGWGLASCQQFLDSAKESQDNVFRLASWIEGYISAANIYTDDTYDLAPWQNAGYLLELIGRNCQNNPDERFIRVVHAYVQYLHNDRLRTRQEQIQAASGDNRILVYKSVLRDVQEALNDAGYSAGTPDGLYGQGTRGALEAYQQANNLPVTGLPDSLTVERLLIAPKRAEQQQQQQQ